MTFTLHHGDCLDLLRTIPDARMDLVFLDPPYGLNIAAWDTTLPPDELFAATLAILKPGGSLYATCSSHILPTFLRLLPYRRVIAWGKPNLPLRKHLNEWEWSTEFVVWVTHGEPRVFNKPSGEDARDYWRIPVENGFLRKDTFHHPARKPLALLERIITASTHPGDVVFDPFMGSGTTGVACVNTGRHFIGIEKAQQYYDIARERITHAAQQHQDSIRPT